MTILRFRVAQDHRVACGCGAPRRRRPQFGLMTARGCRGVWLRLCGSLPRFPRFCMARESQVTHAWLRREQLCADGWISYGGNAGISPENSGCRLSTGRSEAMRPSHQSVRNPLIGPQTVLRQADPPPDNTVWTTEAGGFLRRGILERIWRSAVTESVGKPCRIHPPTPYSRRVVDRRRRTSQGDPDTTWTLLDPGHHRPLRPPHGRPRPPNRHRLEAIAPTVHRRGPTRDPPGISW